MLDMLLTRSARGALVDDIAVLYYRCRRHGAALMRRGVRVAAACSRRYAGVDAQVR